jgi:hypothetical protein
MKNWHTSIANKSTVQEDYTPNIGKWCVKISGKPFKGGNKTNTITDVVNHPMLNVPAYTFAEDHAFVECRRCSIVDVFLNKGVLERVSIVGLSVLNELEEFNRLNSDELEDYNHIDENGKHDLRGSIIKKKKYVELCGVKVKSTSQRYLVFKKSLVCVTCGIEGKYFAIEKTDKTAKFYHLNLYGINDEGKEVLMTKDHIWPVSHGGEDRLINYQTMCTHCNKNKGATLPEEMLIEEILFEEC